MHWMPFAMVRIAAFYVVGVLVGIFYPAMLHKETSIRLFILFSLSYFPVYFLAGRSRQRKTVTGFVGLMAITLAGFVKVGLTDATFHRGNVFLSDSIRAYKVKVISPAEEKAKSWKRIGEVTAVLTPAGWKTGEARINLYWPKQELVEKLDYGDELLIRGHPQEIEPAYNPEEFDFRRHNAIRHIGSQHYVKAGTWILEHASTDQGFIFYAHRARAACVAIFKQFIASPQEQGIILALVLGVTDGLDNEVLSAYAASGAMHVLAVSGMHVSILYALLLFVVKLVKKTASTQWAIALISLFLLWMYAFITGLSPSVLRAVTMFSFVALATPMARNTNIYNTLAASALLLLLYDPYLILSAGFQLSYLAVLGIVYLQRPLYNLWEAPNTILNWAWQITTVSIAAQLATVSISIFYFHQFPVYFLLANLFVIPASTLVLLGGIGLLAISPIASAATWVGIALEWFTARMNDGLFLTEALPHSLINQLYLTSRQVFLLMGIILGLILLFQYRKFSAVIFIFLSAMLFSSDAWYDFIEIRNHPHWVVYRIPGHPGMEWLHHSTSIFEADSVLSRDRQKIRFHLTPNRIRMGTKEVVSDSGKMVTNGLDLRVRDQRIWLWIKNRNFKLPQHLKVDYLVVSNNAVAHLSRLDSTLEVGQLILDGTNHRNYTDRILKESARLGIPAFAVMRQGAFVVRL